MALLVWLPLNGNLNNQGIDQVSITTTNTSWQDDGKIGKCLKLGYSNNFTIPSLIGAKQMTITYWVKVNTATATNWLSSIHFYSSDGNEELNKSYQAFLNNCASSGIWYQGGFLGLANSQDYSIGEWNHYAFTFNYSTGEVNFYLNGFLFQSETNLDVTHYITGTDFGFGQSGLDISENDLRIYDKALSPREIKEISKAMVLHLPLDHSGFGNDNILPNTFSFSEYSAYNGGSYSVYNGYKGVEHCLEVMPSSSTTSSGARASFNDSLPLTGGQQYTYSCMIWSSIPDTFAFDSLGHFQTAAGSELHNRTIEHEGDVIPAGIWTPVRITFTPTVDCFAFRSYFIYFASTDQVIYVKDIKLEKGDVVTPWSPHPDDSMAVYLDTREVDESGYLHNGTKYGEFTYSLDTPRNRLSTVFDGTNHIALGRVLIKDELTYSWWGYADDWTNFGGAMVSSVEGGGMGQQGNTYLWFGCGTGTTSNSYITGYRLPAPSQGWHMFTETWDGYRFKMYLDGELKYTEEQYPDATTKTPIFYTASYNYLFVGGESSASATTPDNHFTGKISDFRVYATALSAEDILELYNAPITATSNGSLMTQGMFYEYSGESWLDIDKHPNIFNKTGIIDVSGDSDCDIILTNEDGEPLEDQSGNQITGTIYFNPETSYRPHGFYEPSSVLSIYDYNILSNDFIEY